MEFPCGNKIVINVPITFSLKLLDNNFVLLKAKFYFKTFIFEFNK